MDYFSMHSQCECSHEYWYFIIDVAVLLCFPAVINVLDHLQLWCRPPFVTQSGWDHSSSSQQLLISAAVRTMTTDHLTIQSTSASSSPLTPSLPPPRPHDSPWNMIILTTSCLYHVCWFPCDRFTGEHLPEPPSHPDVSDFWTNAFTALSQVYRGQPEASSPAAVR